MDERSLPKSPGFIERCDPEQGALPGSESTFVFFGDPVRVSDGFAMALHAMGITASIADVTRASRPDRENDDA